MKTIKIFLILCLVFSVFALVSCGTDDAAMNNGSDTGVSRSYSNSYNDHGYGAGSNGMVEDDVYANDGFADDNFYNDSMMAGDGMTGTDMSYDMGLSSGNEAGNSTINY